MDHFDRCRSPGNRVGHRAEICRWVHALLAKRDRLVAAVTSFVMLSVALKSLPVGTAYAVWVGIGAFGVAIVGMLALGESASVLRLIFLVLILAGIVGLKMVEA